MGRMTCDDADKVMRRAVEATLPHVHEVLVGMVRSEELPDIGFLKLEDMAKKLAWAGCQEIYNEILEIPVSPKERSE